MLSFNLQFAGTSWDELRHIRQAVGFLVCELFPKQSTCASYLTTSETDSPLIPFSFFHAQVLHQKVQKSLDELTNELCPVSKLRAQTSINVFWLNQSLLYFNNSINIIKHCFQVLSVPQIYRIGTMFWDDKYGTQDLSPEVRNFLFHLGLLLIFLAYSK